MFSFEYTLTRDDEDILVDVVYTASAYSDGDIDIDSVEVTYLNKPFETTEAEDSEIIARCFELAPEDFQAQADDYGDYLHEMRREWED